MDRLLALSENQHVGSPSELIDILLADVLAAEVRKDDVAILVARVVT
jgi:hypothetical protein